jgi:hypothetical protein
MRTANASTDELLEVIQDITRTHGHLQVAVSQHDRLMREIALLKGQLITAEQALAALRIENLTLRKQIRQLGHEPSAVGTVAGDSR